MNLESKFIWIMFCTCGVMMINLMVVTQHKWPSMNRIKTRWTTCLSNPGHIHAGPRRFGSGKNRLRIDRVQLEKPLENHPKIQRKKKLAKQLEKQLKNLREQSNALRWQFKAHSTQSVQAAARNIYFLKVHKTGSSMLATILSAFAWRNELRVTTYKKLPNKPFQPGNHIQVLCPPFVAGNSTRYNVILEHTHYEPDVIVQVLEMPVRCVSMVRSPVAWLQSFLSYTTYFTKTKLTSDRVQTAAEFVQKLDNPLWVGRHWAKLQRMRNWTSKLFLINTTSNHVGRKDALRNLADIFLVGITEHFDESLILFRRQLGWTMKDILFSQRDKKWKEQDPQLIIRDKVYKRLCEWMMTDCRLYDFFNATFWQMIYQEGDSLHEEVKHFRLVRAEVETFCDPILNSIKQEWKSVQKLELDAVLKIPHSTWHGPFNYTMVDCALLHLNPQMYRALFYYRQNKRRNCWKRCPFAEGQPMCHHVCQLQNRTDLFQQIMLEKDSYAQLKLW